MPRRRLTEEERALWARVAATAEPIRPLSLAEPEITAPPPPVLDAKPDVGGLRIQSVRPARSHPRVTLDLAPDPAVVARAHPHMDRRRFEKLRRGKFEPEARLDLHGMTLDRAHGALIAFVLGAHGAGLRLVLVITGKGREGDAGAIAPHRRGALRHAVPHWLAAPPLVGRVLQTAPAHARHGGAGALYVYLRRQR